MVDAVQASATTLAPCSEPFQAFGSLSETQAPRNEQVHWQVIFAFLSPSGIQAAPSRND